MLRFLPAIVLLGTTRAVIGLLQSGVSLNIPANVLVKKTGWQKIENWQAPVESGHIITGTYLTGKSNSDVYVPLSGMYVVFATVSLTGADSGGVFKASLIVNELLNNTQNGMTSTSKGGPLGPKSLVVQGVLYLQRGDLVSVYAYSELDADWSITGQSETTLSMQYVESLGIVPGFSAYLPINVQVQNTEWNTMRNWEVKGFPGVFKSMTGFSKHVGEFVPICDGIYLVAANIRIQTNLTLYFEISIIIDSVVNENVVKRTSSEDFTLSISTSLHLHKGQIISLKIKGHGPHATVMAGSGFSAVFLSSYSSTTPGFSTILQNQIQGSGGGWVRISLTSPAGSTHGQFQTDSKYITNGKYYPPVNGLYLVTASIRLLADSLIAGTIFTRAISSSALNGNIIGLFSRATKSSFQEEVTLSTSGIIQLLTTQPILSFYIYMQNAGNYRILPGSRIAVSMIQPRYPAFHATLDAEASQSSNNAWIEITTWKVNKVTGSFSMTDNLSPTNGRYTAEITGIYHVSSNVIFSGQSSYISLLIAANGDQSKRKALFSTKGNPASKDSLSVSGNLELTKGDFVSVLVKVFGTSSWSVGDKSSFTVAFLGLPFSVPGFSTVLASTRTYSTDAWHQVKGLLPVSNSAPMFYYGGGLDLAECKYSVPESGLYIISANLKLTRATAIDAEFTANIAIDDNPASKQYINGMADFIARTVSLGSENFYSLNIAGVTKLNKNQNITLWVKSHGAGIWDISEDSSFSVALLHVSSDFHASGFQAVLNPLISQSVSGATEWKLIRAWVTTRSNTGKGLFHIDKYQDLAASSGTVTIRESDLYFISASITLKDAVGRFEVGVHLQSRLAGLYSLVDSSKLSRYTMKLYGILQISAGDILSIQVQAPTKRNWEQDILHCGLSFVKLVQFEMPLSISSTLIPQRSLSLQHGNWSRLQNWATALTPVQYATGPGFSRKSGTLTVDRDGIFIISTYIVAETNQGSPTVHLKLVLNQNNSQDITSYVGNGLSTLNSNCNKSCVLHLTAAMSLQKSDKLELYVQSNDVIYFHIQNSSMLSIDLISESLPLPNGMLGQLPISQRVGVKGNKQITGWQLKSGSGNFFGSTGNMDSFYIQSTGIYFVSIHIKFQRLQGLATAFTSLVNIPAITASQKSVSDNPFVLSVTGCMKINSGGHYTVTVFSETDSSYEILLDSIKSGVYLGPISKMIGFIAALSETKSINFQPNNPTYISGWSVAGKDWLFESGTGFSNRISFVAPSSGTYYVSCQLILSATVNSSSTLITLGAELDGFMLLENGLFTSGILTGAVTTTLVLSGSIYLQKWTQVKLVMKSSTAVSVTVSIDSTFSIVKLSKDVNMQRCIDNGPNLVGHLNPDVLRTAFKRPVSWQCAAVGQSVAYGWMKNYLPLAGQSLATYSISSAQVSDTGDYVCTATHDGIRVSSNIAKLTVFDPMPVFLNPDHQYNLNVTENGASLSGILRVNARARSLDKAFAMMSYEILSGNVNNTFSLKPNRSDNGFMLMRNRILDRENISSYSIEVKATNMDAYSFAIQQINISVVDENDNRPVFTQKLYKAAIYENTTVGTTVIRVHATDRDIGDNAKIRYWCIPSSSKNVFVVNPSTGYVTLQEPLDRETRDLYWMFLTASDPAFTVYTELSIEILDVNEHAPVFKPDVYSINVSETLLPGSSILNVLATDKDIGKNAELFYSIENGDPEGIFRITKHGTIQNKHTLDYEKNTSFTLVLSVRDNGQPPLYATNNATVNIYVTDANDNSPEFERDNYVVSVFENTTTGQEILRVHAKDRDAPGKPESIVKYNFDTSSNLSMVFHLDQTTGIIRLNTPLDFEMTSSYRFTVVAADGGIPSLKDKAQVTVNIIDVNDNRPYFTTTRYTVNVTESSQINREVFKVTAIDNDSGLNAQLRYSLIAGDKGNTFTVDPISGSVIAMNPLDREKDSQYNLVISCEDMGNPQLTSSNPLRLQVNVLDENDNPPVFGLQQYSARVKEDMKIGSTILVMNITDPDAGRNGMFNVSIVKTGSKNMFAYDSQRNALILIGKLDFERDAFYHFTVTAKDFGSPALEKSVSVDITVENVNDNAPKFEHAVYNSRIPDMAFGNITVYQMIATDPDVGPSGRISYEIVSGNTDGQFKIGLYTGIVETAKDLNTTFTSSFMLEIIAKDGYQPPAISNRTKLNILVTKTPPIRLSNTKMGTTSFSTTVDLSGFVDLHVTGYQVLIQEYNPNDVNFNMMSSQPPVTWYDVNMKSSAMDDMRRYAALAFRASKINGAWLSANSNRSVSVVIGAETVCNSNKKLASVCNGPLKSNKAYRLQMRGFVSNSKFPRDSHFSVPVKLGEPAATTAKIVNLGANTGTLGLAIAFAASTILAIISLCCYVNYKRKHQILYVDHVRKMRQLTETRQFTSESSPKSLKSGFGPLSDISIWPQMSMAEASHMFQRSQGLPTENYGKIPRSPGDSGINHGFEDDDSWRLNLSDENDDSFEDAQQARREMRQVAVATSNNKEIIGLIQTENSKLSEKHGSTSSLESNADSYQPPRLSESLRGIFRSDERWEDKANNSNNAEMSIITEESENEIETEFGPEIETTLGPDADQSSIDEEL